MKTMKSTALFLTLAGLQAADDAAPHEGVMMKDGKMCCMKDGKTMPMEEDMKATNGTVVTKDGHVTMKDGKTMMLKECQMVSTDEADIDYRTAFG